MSSITKIPWVSPSHWTSYVVLLGLYCPREWWPRSQLPVLTGRVWSAWPAALSLQTESVARTQDAENAPQLISTDTATIRPTFASTGRTTTLESASDAGTLAATTAVGAATATTDETVPLERSSLANQSATWVRKNGGSSSLFWGWPRCYGYYGRDCSSRSIIPSKPVHDFSEEEWREFIAILRMAKIQDSGTWWCWRSEYRQCLSLWFLGLASSLC